MHPKSLTGVINLPDVRLNFHLSFDGEKGGTEPRGEESKLLGRIFEQAVVLSPELQELMIDFAEFIKGVTEKAKQDPVN